MFSKYQLLAASFGLASAITPSTQGSGDGNQGATPPPAGGDSTGSTGVVRPGYVAPCRAPYGNQTGCSYCKNELGALPAKQDNVTITPFNDVEFASKEGMPGYAVWFSIPEPEDSCKTLIIVPAHDAEPAFGTKGVTVVSAERAGCYGATVSSEGYGVAKCCGNDDCKTAGAGLLKKKRSLPRAPSPLSRRKSVQERRHEYEDLIKSRSVETSAEVEAPLAKRYTTWADPHTSSPDSPPVAPPTDPNARNCKPAKKKGDGPIQRAAIQQVNETEYFCNGVGGEACRLDWGVTQTTSQSFQVGNATTNTQTDSSSIAVTAGWNSIEGPTASITGTVGHDESNAIEQSLSATTDNSKSTTTNYDMIQAPNTFAKLTFVPYQSCLQYTVTCDDGDHDVEHCTTEDPTAGYPFLMYTG